MIVACSTGPMPRIAMPASGACTPAARKASNIWLRSSCAAPNPSEVRGTRNEHSAEVSVSGMTPGRCGSAAARPGKSDPGCTVAPGRSRAPAPNVLASPPLAAATSGRRIPPGSSCDPAPAPPRASPSGCGVPSGHERASMRGVAPAPYASPTSSARFVQNTRGTSPTSGSRRRKASAARSCRSGRRAWICASGAEFTPVRNARSVAHGSCGAGTSVAPAPTMSAANSVRMRAQALRTTSARPRMLRAHVSVSRSTTISGSPVCPGPSSTGRASSSRSAPSAVPRAPTRSSGSSSTPTPQLTPMDAGASGPSSSISCQSACTHRAVIVSPQSPLPENTPSTMLSPGYWVRRVGVAVTPEGLDGPPCSPR